MFVGYLSIPFPSEHDISERLKNVFKIGVMDDLIRINLDRNPSKPQLKFREAFTLSLVCHQKCQKHHTLLCHQKCQNNVIR